MTGLPKVRPRVPRWKLELFNTQHSWWDAKGIDIHVARDSEYDIRRCGWLCLDDTMMNIMDVDIRWDIRKKPTGNIRIDGKDSWMLGLDLIGKAQAIFYYEREGEGQIPDHNITYASRIVFYIDNTDIEDHIPHGTVSVYGGVYDTTEYITETIRVDGPGVYITEHIFGDVFTLSADMEEEGAGSSATMSVWGKRGLGCGMRECRIWCDTNGDGVYGLVFGGYIREQKTKLDNCYPIVCYDLMGYAEFLQCNEYIAGYRGVYRCANFSKTGVYGACSVNSTCFRAGGSSCYVGDWNTAHPSGQLVTATGYTCPDYVPDDTEPLPNDGWTYDQYYAPTTDAYYEYYPPTYFRALQAACNMANSLEFNKPVSRYWDLPMHVERELLADINETQGIISFVMVPDSEEIPKNSRAVCEFEIFKVQARGRNGIGALRGFEKTIPSTHPKGTKVQFPKIAWATDETEPSLVKAYQLQDSNLKHTIQDTLDSLAENATSGISNTEIIPWVDCFKQIQFSELDGECTGYDSKFEITADDIVQNPSYCLSDVINKISAQVDITDEFWVYCEMSTDSPELAGYEHSRSVFGTFSEEVNNVNLTAMEPTEGKLDFKTFATKFLKLTAFPRLIETIVVDSFVPDEHYWRDVNVSDPDKRPYLDYTDAPNKHINILGTTLTAPDFFKPRTETGEWDTSTFWVEGIRYSSRVDGSREFLTTLILSRLTTPEEWV